MALVGNKVDLCQGSYSQRQVDGDEVSEHSTDELKSRYFETSALKDINVREMMEHIIESAYQARLRRQEEELEDELQEIRQNEFLKGSFKIRNSLHAARPSFAEQR